jgi:hypothetical protein
MNIAAPAALAVAAVLSAACGGRTVGSEITSDAGLSNVDRTNIATPDSGIPPLDQSQSYCFIDTSRGCPCPSGSVCVSGPAADGSPLLGCVPLDVECGGRASCDCMHCVCDGLGSSCGGTTGEESSGAGVVLQCM